jgi:hypothetical protein
MATIKNLRNSNAFGELVSVIAVFPSRVCERQGLGLCSAKIIARCGRILPQKTMAAQPATCSFHEPDCK